jgi:endonuclease/exonuclease/phosphatase family metal-dependent hydrolase
MAIAASVSGFTDPPPALQPACRAMTGSPTAPITWTLPPDPSDRARLDRWCAAVGPAVIADFAPPAERSAASVTVVTWNTHAGAGDIAAFTGELRRGALTGTPVDEFVLLLQEAVRRGPAVPVPTPAGAATAGRIAFDRESFDVVEAARSARLNVVYVPSMRNGAEAEDRGNAVLTTLPISAVENIELPFGRQRRVAIAATLTPPGGDLRFRIVNAHFDTALRFGVGGPAAWRRRQADALLNAIRGSALPTVVGGDFNTWWGNDEPAVDDLLHAFPAAKDRVTGETWRGPLATRARLDHMFASGWDGPLDVRRAARRFGSDHYPLYMVITP